jgi:NCS1 family nucleobase:cation symporter-1
MTTQFGETRTVALETNGINVIADEERKGRPRDLFWPWFGANVSVLGLSYGAFVLGFGISFWQAVIVGIIGVVVSFLLCGFVAIAGKRGSAPTMILSRAAFGVRGNKLPSLISWLLTVGWETVLVILATLATAAVFGRLGWGSGDLVKIVAMLVVTALTILGGVAGFDVIMKMQKWITIITGILTIAYIGLVAKYIDFSVVTALPAGGITAVLGALVFVMTAFGLGWVNAAADYSRYLPRKSSGKGVVGWTTFGGALAPMILVLFGLLLAGSSTKGSGSTADLPTADLITRIGADPIGALAELLPTWFLVIFVIVAVLGLVGGAVLDIYSSGLALLSLGVKVQRYVAALIDGTIMLAGTVAVVFFVKGGGFISQFQGFLITLGVPVAAWAGVMLADVLLRRQDYAERELFDRRGRYGDVQWDAVGLVALGTALGWGLVTNTAAGWLSWQGYFLGPLNLGGRTGAWAYSNIGVLVALLIGFLGTLIFSPWRVRRQEGTPMLRYSDPYADSYR